MACYNYGKSIVCMSFGLFRLRLLDGRYVFMDWHNYLGPLFYKDRGATREIELWYEDDMICEALDWFVRRGRKA